MISTFVGQLKTATTPPPTYSPTSYDKEYAKTSHSNLSLPDMLSKMKPLDTVGTTTPTTNTAQPSPPPAPTSPQEAEMIEKMYEYNIKSGFNTLT